MLLLALLTTRPQGGGVHFALQNRELAHKNETKKWPEANITVDVAKKTHEKPDVHVYKRRRTTHAGTCCLAAPLTPEAG